MKQFIAIHSKQLHCTYEVPLRTFALLRHEQLKAQLKAVSDLEIVPMVIAEFEDDNKVRQFAHSVAWTDIADTARLIEWNAPMPNCLLGLWSEPYDEPKVAALPSDRENLTAAPVDLYASLAWQRNSKVTVDIMTNGNNEVTGAIMIISGTQEEVHAYMAICAQLGKQIEEHPDGRPRRPYRH